MTAFEVFKNILNLSFLNMKSLSEIVLGLLVIQIQIQAVCYDNKRSAHLIGLFQYLKNKNFKNKITRKPNNM